jgi:hypothetical protein
MNGEVGTVVACSKKIGVLLGLKENETTGGTGENHDTFN